MHGDILTEEEMQKEMELQSSRLATIQRYKEQEEEERRQQEAEAEEARCFGYCDTLSPMAAGKARNALYKSVMYKGKAMKKKDFIKMLADSGNYTAQEKFFSNYKNGKSLCYCIVHEDESFYTVSKTEYNLFKFLTEKGGITMYFEGFIDGYFVHTEKWYDGTIYFNVQYFRPSQSINQPPVFDKSVYITDNDKGRYMVQNFKSSLAEYVARMDIKPENRFVITV